MPTSHSCARESVGAGPAREDQINGLREGGTMMPYSWHSFQVRVVASSVSLAKAFASATSSCMQSKHAG